MKTPPTWARTHLLPRSANFLLSRRDDYATASSGFRAPDLQQFNWALGYFDVMARGNTRCALHAVDDEGNSTRVTFDEMRERSNRAANFLRGVGVRRGDRLLIMLGNVVPLWELTLAAIKLGAVFTPATALLTTDDLQDRIDRGGVRHVIVDAAGAAKFDRVGGTFTRIVVEDSIPGWTTASLDAVADFTPDGPTSASDPLLLYFTSGTTAKPKIVQHTHSTYPVGHLSTMYWIGLREGDLHWNISSPGWAKHAWSSFFAPWNAGASIFVYNYTRFEAKRVLDAIARHRVTTLCAPPTVWRMLILEDLGAYDVGLREAVGAGEPLNPDVIERVRNAWGITIRDGYGQTETTCLFGNSPGQPVKPGSMGRPMPGYRMALLDAEDREADDGEVVIELDPPPIGLMKGYLETPMPITEANGKRYYRTADVASRDADGYCW